MIVKLVFWISAGTTFYVYAGYPLLLELMQLLFRRPMRKEAITPSVSLLIAAYNEAGVIATKISNALALDYPSHQLEIVLASDGSTDETVAIVRSLISMGGRGPTVRLLEFSENRGKLAVLNDCIPQLGGEIVVFSDATSMLASNSLRHLVANFADPEVGAVSGVYTVVNHCQASLGSQEDFYWRYETFLKAQEAKIGGLTGAHGSLYAMRKSLYPFPPAGAINDDFVIPTSVLRLGFRIAYETKAISYEEAAEMEGFGRRVRIMAGNVEQLRQAKSLLWPLRPLPLFCFLSHKGGRVLVPSALLALFLGNLLLWHSPFYRWFFWAQIGFYVLAFVGAFRGLRPKLLRLPFYFCWINAAWFVWLYRVVFCRGGEASYQARTHAAWH